MLLINREESPPRGRNPEKMQGDFYQKPSDHTQAAIRDIDRNATANHRSTPPPEVATPGWWLHLHSIPQRATVAEILDRVLASALNATERVAALRHAIGELMGLVPAEFDDAFEATLLLPPI